MTKELLDRLTKLGMMTAQERARALYNLGDAAAAGSAERVELYRQAADAQRSADRLAAAKRAMELRRLARART